ncbi:hypothetical protein [Yersinia mollaretii]|uniref:hypothetical protein n=1 Tax=Yersinia mollaretii TaxID=33060 RepID=UPI0011A3869E|nr:hypothetical protein [Yersinia mollaretii]
MKLSLMIGHILRVIFCAYQRKYNCEWDRKINAILDEGEFDSLNEYTIDYKYKENYYDIWINNQWYAYAYLRSFNDVFVRDSLQFRPSFKTMIKLHQKVRIFKSLDLKSDFRRIYLDEDKL